MDSIYILPGAAAHLDRAKKENTHAFLEHAVCLSVGAQCIGVRVQASYCDGGIQIKF